MLCPVFFRLSAFAYDFYQYKSHREANCDENGFTGNQSE